MIDKQTEYKGATTHCTDARLRIQDNPIGHCVIMPQAAKWFIVSQWLSSDLYLKA